MEISSPDDAPEYPTSGDRYVDLSTLVVIGGGLLQPLFLPSPVHHDRRVWHYTDSAGLLGILSSHELWATTSTMLNDSLEIIHGVDLLDQVWKDLRDLPVTDLTCHCDKAPTRMTWESPRKPACAPGVCYPLTERHYNYVEAVIGRAKEKLLANGAYVVCASLDGDSLSQWRGYTNGVGFAVGLGASRNLVSQSRYRVRL